MAFFNIKEKRYQPRPIPPTPPYVPPVPPTPPDPGEGSVPHVPRPSYTNNAVITLYQMYDDNNTIDKQVSSGINISGVFSDDTDILNPVVEIQSNYDLTQYNYAYIDILQRYYYMHVVLMDNNRYRLIMNVDVLKSYADGIKNCVGICTKCDDDRFVNLDLDDGSFVNKEGIAIKLDVFDSGFLDVPKNILIVAGGGY